MGQVLAQGVVHRVHIVGDGAEDFPLGMRVVIVQLQVVHLPVNITPQSLYNAGGQLSHAEALENGEKLGHKIKGYQRHEQPDDRFPVEGAACHAIVQFRGDAARHRWGQNGKQGTQDSGDHH